MSEHSLSLLSRDEAPARVILSVTRSDYTGTLLSCVLLTVLLYDHGEYGNFCSFDADL